MPEVTTIAISAFTLTFEATMGYEVVVIYKLTVYIADTGIAERSDLVTNAMVIESSTAPMPPM